MFKFLKSWKKTPETKVPSGEAVSASESMPLHDKVIDDLMTESIAAPKAPDTFQPIDVVLPNQVIAGEFNYHSSTWKYLQHYLTDRIVELHRKNENATIKMEKTQLIRGQLKEIKLLLNHTNQLAGVTSPPTNSPLSNLPTG